MGFKEEINRLIAEKRAILDQQERNSLARQEEETQKKLAKLAQLEAQEAELIKNASAQQAFNAQVQHRILLPTLQELQIALNNTRDPHKHPWRLQEVTGNDEKVEGYWQETSYDGPYEWHITSSANFCYSGIALTRIIDKTRDHASRTMDEWVNTTQYDAIFVGSLNTKGTVLLTTGERRDEFNHLARVRSLMALWMPNYSNMELLHASKGIRLATFDYPRTSPETLNQDLAHLNDPNSEWVVKTKPLITQGLTASLQYLPEYK